ncbi:hypothetical protein AVEN_191229-1 [Araneus ventricosus]|uniref:Uncharacterized protein n=1 Tax=Araneus ventricosus TaxID=182803 RepID=A0A4Y2PFQ8_ARAVE|nr:hypothetical protein AVEN_266611-1 [Araneus ventricosus]GBN50080.1 hypothetical protein AVEN_191229-1 [Araneus ventricosus]
MSDGKHFALFHESPLTPTGKGGIFQSTSSKTSAENTANTKKVFVLFRGELRVRLVKITPVWIQSKDFPFSIVFVFWEEEKSDDINFRFMKEQPQGLPLEAPLAPSGVPKHHPWRRFLFSL